MWGWVPFGERLPTPSPLGIRRRTGDLLPHDGIAVAPAVSWGLTLLGAYGNGIPDDVAKSCVHSDVWFRGGPGGRRSRRRRRILARSACAGGSAYLRERYGARKSGGCPSAVSESSTISESSPRVLRLPPGSAGARGRAWMRRHASRPSISSLSQRTRWCDDATRMRLRPRSAAARPAPPLPR